jgi:hypothetical protein
VRGTLFDPASGGLSRHYPTGQGVIPFEARRSPQKWTHVLEPVRDGMGQLIGLAPLSDPATSRYGSVDWLSSRSLLQC